MEISKKQKEEIKLKMQAIEESCLEQLKESCIELAHDVSCEVRSRYVEIGLKNQSEDGYKFSWGSEIKIYSIQNDRLFGYGKNEINFGTTGVFSPDNRESYWRTIYAASVVKNWDVVCKIVNEHCDMYDELTGKIN